MVSRDCLFHLWFLRYSIDLFRLDGSTDVGTVVDRLSGSSKTSIVSVRKISGDRCVGGVRPCMLEMLNLWFV